MNHSWKAGLSVMVVALASACVDIADSDELLAEPEAELLATAESELSECLAVDATKNYSAGLLGARGDDNYPMNGRVITRVEFNRSVDCNDRLCIGGHGDAYISKQDSESIKVHFWYDAFTKLTYHLKVWVNC